MAEPGAADGRGPLRASHADREQVIEVLKAAFVQGRLTKGELDARAGQAFASRTLAELAAVTADIPAGLVAPPPRLAARARPQRSGNATLKKGARVITAATVLTAGLWAASVATGSSALAALVLTGTITWVGIVLLVGAVMLDSVDKQRSRGPLPPRRTPRAGGPGPRRAAPSAGEGEPPPIDQASRATAVTAPRPCRPGYSVGCAAEALFRSR